MMPFLRRSLPTAATVIIPNWNGRGLLASISLPSLTLQTLSGFEVLVVDNGSTDGSTAYLREAWPEVRVIQLATNVGFAAAVNAGVAASSTPFVALLNNDVE